jgi:hypothetical protein
MNNIAALAAAAAATGPDLNKATTGGGGDYVPPAAGQAWARFIGYVETGSHEKSVGAGKPKVVKPQVELIFELSGPRHAPKELEDGSKLPHRISEDANAAANYGPLNEKAGLYKLFRRMNYDGSATHFAQLLGKAYLVTVHHTKKTYGDKERTFVSLRDPDGAYSISPPNFTDPVTGEVKSVPVPEPISPLRLFVWNAAPEHIGPMWDSLFIDGEYPERKDKDGNVTSAAKSKNVFQNTIKDALNFNGSPIHEYLQTKGVPLNLGAAVGNAAPAAESAASTATSGTTPKAADADPLAQF